jgi:16S rRNA U516 pseudouridylate synthase RsuA-like enzyme
LGYFVQTDLKSENFLHPRGETKKTYFVRGESKKKILQGGKTKLAHITEGINLFTQKLKTYILKI